MLKMLTWMLVLSFAIPLGNIALAESPLPDGVVYVDSLNVSGNLKKSIETYSKSLVAVTVRNQKTHAVLDYSTGFVGAPGDRVFAASHVFDQMVKNPGDYVVEMKQEIDGKWESLELRDAFDYIPEFDLAIFFLTKKHPAVPNLLALHNPEIGSRVMILACDAVSTKKRVSFGHVIAPTREPWTNQIQFSLSAASVQGLSGGMAVLLDHQGNAVGAIGMDIGYAGTMRNIGSPGRLIENASYVNLDGLNAFLLLSRVPGLVEKGATQKWLNGSGISPESLEIFHLLSTEKRIADLEHRFDNFLEKLDQAPAAKQTYIEINNELAKMSRGFLLNPPLFDLPSKTNSEIEKRFAETSFYPETRTQLLAARDSIRIGFKRFDSQIAFFESPAEIDAFFADRSPLLDEKLIRIPGRMIRLPE